MVSTLAEWVTQADAVSLTLGFGLYVTMAVGFIQYLVTTAGEFPGKPEDF